MGKGYGLGRWVDGQTARSPAAAYALLMAMPGGPYVASPYRFVDRNSFETFADNARINALIDSAPLEDVPIASLCSIQHTVARARVAQYLTDPKSARPRVGQKDRHHGGVIDYPIVVRERGMNLIFDGHHRTMATMLLGARLIKARYIDFDAWLAAHPTGTRVPAASSGA